ncbi:uncharacterized protein C12orf40-like [Strongylocentrotus purpuratus]|uniref:Uncharacterized protein n=1 Tax=Strongylocentrotus purpuratus TaxID=7668 RepID=A0A7M7PTJ4_STRPU|nr:uncharacterized protein C12orf40-like [Strongylocentrotus purpuratus]
MNWMGGVRNRLKVKNDRKRQQDFFEKQKFTSKVRKLETTTNPPKRKQAVSLDLLSLQAANFSAAHYKKNGTGIRSSGRINRINLDKSQALLRQKFVNLPDASPESKPSALDLSKPSPQESVVCPKLYPTSRRHPLSTITEDKSPSVTDISSQDLSQMLTSQREQSNIWTSTPANFWHKRKRPNRRNVLLDSKHSIGQGDDHDGVKKEPPFHSPSSSEKLLLDGSRNQIRMMDDTLDSDYWAGKTPGSSTSAWSDLSTIMEDTDDATVPSIEDEDFIYRDVGVNQVSDLKVQTEQWT